MTALATRTRPALADLAAAALAARDAGATRTVPRRRSLEQILDAQQVVTMAQRLSPDELELLGEATGSREAGLRMARDGDLGAAAAHLDDARAIAAAYALSHEGRCCAATFQAAAEAYLAYRRGDAAGAEALTVAAIGDSIELQARYGYGFDLRLVHLARNVVRVRAVGGRRQAALDLALALIGVVAGDPAGWPWPDPRLVSPALSAGDIADMATDQLLAEIAALLGPARPDAATLLAAAPQATRVPPRAADHLAAYRALAAGDEAGFLDAAARFLDAGPGQFGLSWQRLGDDVETVAAAFA
jgi:hypothetical protein